MQTKTLVVDGHVHIYSHYDLKSAIEHGIENLIRAAQSDEPTIPIWLLSERSDCRFFETNRGKVIHGFRLTPTQEEEAIRVEEDGKFRLYILAGRQIVSSDGLEIISAASRIFPEDGKKTTREVIDEVNQNSGVPIINWAPGKWFFERGKIVAQLINHYRPDQLVVGDTTLRTRLWSMPGLMTQAHERGLKIIGGSDPLPFKDEEKQIGRYGFTMKGDFDENRPAESVRRLLKDPTVDIRLIGERNHLFTFARRQFKIMFMN